jgi:hypothetical protein
MSDMSYRRFLAWTAPACVIWSFAYVSVGSAAAGGYRELSEELHWAGYLFVGAIVLFLVIVWGAKKVLLKLEARHMADDSGHARRERRAAPQSGEGSDAAPAPDPSERDSAP